MSLSGAFCNRCAATKAGALTTAYGTLLHMYFLVEQRDVWKDKRRTKLGVYHLTELFSIMHRFKERFQ